MFASAFDPSRPGRTTIAGAPAGHDMRVLAEIAARAPGQPLIHVALDDMRAALIADALGFFAPHVEVIAFPAWDCLPYDRISPHADIAGERIAALARLRQPFKKPAILVTTVNAIVQKTLPPDVLKEASLEAGIGDERPVEKLRAFLASNGYTAAGTVREPGEFAVRGGIVDLFPPGYGQPLRLDFFGDEIESIRLFDAMTQTTTDRLERFHLGPISEVLLEDRAVAQFRTGYRELFGAVTDADPLYEAVTAMRKFPGVEHWLGLFYPKLYSLFDYLPEAPASFDPQADESIQARLAQIADFYEARASLYQAARRAKKGKDQTAAAVYKPVPPDRLYLDRSSIDQALAKRAVAQLSPFAAVESETNSPPLEGRVRGGGAAPAGEARNNSPGQGMRMAPPPNLPLEGGGTGAALPVRPVLDAHGQRGRDFADARAQQQEIPALRNYAAEQQARNRRVAVACYSQGSSDRIAQMLRAHDLTTFHVKSWDELRKLDPRLVALVILGFEHGFVSPDLALVTEQDILGDRLVRPAKKRRASSQFQLELGALNAGDFVVHAEHGIGRYEGLEAVTVLGTAHDCVKLVYDGGDKLYVPVENLDALTRYGSAESGAALDKLGGAGWQQRKSRVKKRLKDMAEALIKIAAERALKTGERIDVPEGTYDEFAARFPYPETEDQAKAIDDVLTDLASG
ncbi:MAG: CarD family transcriptional regulator, partial [Bdellovibrionales bacterium]